ncbi:MAG: AAA family ATPase, partial [Anaerolineae bacterium]|nr:AAA family ATPase [Anaerolineae bacterium]
MLTTISIRHFKQFDDVTIPLDRHVVFIGPNNSGKTTALQALMLWHFGLQQVLARRDDKAPPKRSGVTLNRQDLTAIPVPQMRLLWRNTRTSAKTQDNVLRIAVEGTDGGASWQCALQFTYQNNESFYCRPVTAALPAAVNDVKMAFLPPMSGLVAQEDLLQPGSIERRIGEGRTADVLRNLCYRVAENETAWWQLQS